MNDSKFQDLSPQEQDWLDAYLDGTIEPGAFEALQDRLLESPPLRQVMRRYLALDNSLQNEGSEAAIDASESATAPWLSLAEDSKSAEDSAMGKLISFPSSFRIPLAAAAGLAFLLGSALLYWSFGPSQESGNHLAQSDVEEPSAHGFAVIGKLFDAEWGSDGSSHREGDVLGQEVFRLASGMAEIQFFSGASMTVQGPAEVSLKSAWEASCLEGAVRMQVPPAARGFKLQAPSTEIVDLGTEFGLVVRGGEGHVEVFDGKIAVRHQGEAEKLVTKGNAIDLASDGPSVSTKSGEVAFPDVKQFETRAENEMLSDFERWQTHRDTLARDERLIAYYTFDRETQDAQIPNLTVPRNPELDGAVILAEPVDGRWPEMKSALEFRRPGARVRVNIPGEFPAYTFMVWVRIDSLDRWYNALFMGDGYETGEPHWQIRSDGAMMLSVMVDDSKPNPGSPNDAGLHRVYYSPPMWDRSMSGQWMHLASVFDPANREVSHYVNGERIHRQKIEDRFLIETLRIGNGEIGNWGQPFREEPTFAIRNLNGRLDEMAIFKAALDDEEIAKLFEESRAGRR